MTSGKWQIASQKITGIPHPARGCPKSTTVPDKLRRAGFHTCRLNGLPNDSADKDIRPTNLLGQVSIPSDNDLYT